MLHLICSELSVTPAIFWVVGYTWYVVSCRLHLIYSELSVTSDIFWVVGYTCHILSCLLHLICSELSVTPAIFRVVDYIWYILSLSVSNKLTLIWASTKTCQLADCFQRPMASWQWLEERCRKPMLRIWTKFPLLPRPYFPNAPPPHAPELLDPTLCGILTCKAKAPDDIGCRIL